jgi:hypothetical protein
MCIGCGREVNGISTLLGTIRYKCSKSYPWDEDAQ